MTRRNAVIACMLSLAGAEQVKAAVSQKNSLVWDGNMARVSYEVSLSIELDSKGQKGVKELRVLKDGKEIVLTADEIWEALQINKTKEKTK